MDTTANLSISVGREAVKLLDKWLENRQVARAWFGDLRTEFTSLPKLEWFGRFLLKRQIKITKVLTINDGDWKAVISKSLDACPTWHKDRKIYGGECCWLPLFRAARDELGIKKVLRDTDLSSASIGTVTATPAARLDSWGLITLAYANGGTLQFLESSDGSFTAQLNARDFILSIYQDGLCRPTAAHIEPRETPNQSIESLRSDDWIRLLHHGATYGRGETMVSWVYSRVTLGNLVPPEDIVNGAFDYKLSKTVMDFDCAERIRRILREVIFECHDLWEECLISLRAEKDEKSECIQHQKQVGDALKDLKRVEDILEKGQLIQTQILRHKVMLLDRLKIAFSKEETVDDILHYSKEQLRVFNNDIASLRPDWEVIKKLGPRHRVLVALTRLLRIPQEVVPQLSTRGTGKTILLY